MPLARWPWITLPLTVLALFAWLGENNALEAGKGSSAVVKATATASKLDLNGKQTLIITLVVDKGWHLYANPVNNKDFVSVQTVVVVKGATTPAAVKLLYPAGKLHEEKGGASYTVYEGKVNIQAVVTRAQGDTGPLQVEVRFNACNSARGICLPPGSEKFTLP